MAEFLQTDLAKLNEIWHTDFQEQTEVNAEWVGRVVEASASIYDFSTFNFKRWIADKLIN